MSIFCPEIEPFALIDVIFAPQISRGSTADANKCNFLGKIGVQTACNHEQGRLCHVNRRANCVA